MLRMEAGSVSECESALFLKQLPRNNTLLPSNRTRIMQHPSGIVAAPQYAGLLAYLRLDKRTERTEVGLVDNGKNTDGPLLYLFVHSPVSSKPLLPLSQNRCLLVEYSAIPGVVHGS
jgi:hypothetical protein